MSGSSGDWGACCARTLRLRSVCMRSKWPQRRDWFRPLRPARATHGFRRLGPRKAPCRRSHVSVRYRQTDRQTQTVTVCVYLFCLSFKTDRLLSCSAVALNKLKFTMKDEAVLITSAPIRAPHAPSTYPLRLRLQVYGERSVVRCVAMVSFCSMTSLASLCTL